MLQAFLQQLLKLLDDTNVSSRFIKSVFSSANQNIQLTCCRVFCRHFSMFQNMFRQHDFAGVTQDAILHLCISFLCSANATYLPLSSRSFRLFQPPTCCADETLPSLSATNTFYEYIGHYDLLTFLTLSSIQDVMDSPRQTAPVLVSFIEPELPKTS